MHTPNTASYALAEVFYSIQGEGHHTGMPAVFVRFAGCNLHCAFCDTDHSVKFRWTASEIVDEISTYATHNVIFTGGEPTLQPLYPLVELLHDTKHWVALETNGIIWPPDTLDWITVSPKRPMEYAAVCDEMKVLYYGQALDEYRPVRRLGHAEPLRFLQPISMQNIDETAQAVLEHPEWRLSLQTHKLIGLR